LFPDSCNVQGVTDGQISNVLRYSGEVKLIGVSP
jgi:hypothetical protein